MRVNIITRTFYIPYNTNSNHQITIIFLSKILPAISYKHFPKNDIVKFFNFIATYKINSYIQNKKSRRFNHDGFSFSFRQCPTLPGGLPPSTISAEELNFRVRNGNGWFLFAIITGYPEFINSTMQKISLSPYSFLPSAFEVKSSTY